MGNLVLSSSAFGLEEDHFYLDSLGHEGRDAVRLIASDL